MYLLKGSSLETYRTRFSKHLLIVGSFGVYYHLLSYLLWFLKYPVYFLCSLYFHRVLCVSTGTIVHIVYKVNIHTKNQHAC